MGSRTDCFSQSIRRSVLTLASVFAFTGSLSVNAQLTIPQAGQRTVAPAPNVISPVSRAVRAPIQLDPQAPTLGSPARISAQHSPNVQTILKPEYKLSVEHRHSQLVLTRRNVRRIAVTDSRICNYVQYSPTELAVVGLDIGTTDLMIWFEGQETPAIYEVTVSQDENLEEIRRAQLGRLERRLGELFPNSNVYIVPVGNQVLVKGQAYDSEEADQILQIVRSEVFRSYSQYNGNGRQGNGLQANGQFGNQGQNQGFNGRQQFQDIVVNMLTVPGEYNIKMRVVIAEVSRSQLRDMGVDWNVVFNDGRQGIGAALGGATGTTLSGIFESGEISVLIKWLATNGTATLLAEPTIVCMSGHSASLLAGGEFAVPTIIGLGGGQATSFRGVGTSMVVTPTVIDRDLIRMQIVPEFSAIDGNNSVNGIPGTTVKRVQTTVELREGQTLALGGLISRQTSTQVNRIPLLGDLPYVGSRLFHAKNASEDEVELLVLVTPEIVRPMEPDEVPPTPNYYITHPNDHDLYHYGRTEGNPDTNVYQLQPFGTGQNRGIPSNYLMQHAGMVPQYATPAGGVGSQSGQPAAGIVPGNGAGLQHFEPSPVPGAVPAYPQPQQNQMLPPVGQPLPMPTQPGVGQPQAVPPTPGTSPAPSTGLQPMMQSTSNRYRSPIRRTTGVISNQTIQPVSHQQPRR